MESTKVKKCLGALLLNFLIALAVFGYYMVKDKGMFSLSYDFDSQIYPFMKLTLDAIHNHSGLWNWNLDLGADIVSSMSYYTINSPFFWLFSWIEGKNVLYVLGWEYILKYAFAGLFSYMYFQKHTKSYTLALTGSVLYAFSGFQTVNLIYLIFHDSVALFPLLLLSFEEMMENEKKYFFALIVALCALLNYYCFVGEVIFLLIYFICRYLIDDGKRAISKIPRCIGEGMLGCVMASVLLIPSLQSVLSNSRVSERLGLSAFLSFNRRDFLQLLSTFLLPSEMMMDRSIVRVEDWSSRSAYLPMVGITLCICYLFRRKKGKGWLKRLLLIDFILMIIPLGSGLFSLYTTTYCRWYYMPILFICLSSIKTLEDIRSYQVKVISVSMAIIVVLQYFAFRWWHEHMFEMVYNVERFRTLTVIAVLGCVAICLIAFIQNDKYRNICMLIAIGGFALYTTSYTCNLYQTFDHKESKQLQAQEKVLENMQIEEGGRVFTKEDNLGMLVGFPSTYSFISTVNGSISEFWNSLGLKKITFSPIGPEGTDELLSVKYYLSQDKLDDLHLIKEYSYEDYKYYLYEAPRYLNIGFTYESYILKSEFLQLDIEDRALVMLKTLVIPDDKTVEDLEHIMVEQLREPNALDVDKLVEAHSREQSSDFMIGHDTFACTIRSSDNKYAFFSVPYDRGWKARVNGEKVEIINVNGMMAIPVFEGNNDIVFEYTNVVFIISAWCSLGGLIAWLLLIFNSRERKK